MPEAGDDPFVVEHLPYVIRQLRFGGRAVEPLFDGADKPDARLVGPAVDVPGQTVHGVGGRGKHVGHGGMGDPGRQHAGVGALVVAVDRHEPTDEILETPLRVRQAQHVSEITREPKPRFRIDPVEAAQLPPIDVGGDDRESGQQVEGVFKGVLPVLVPGDGPIGVLEGRLPLHHERGDAELGHGMEVVGEPFDAVLHITRQPGPFFEILPQPPFRVGIRHVAGTQQVKKRFARGAEQVVDRDLPDVQPRPGVHPAGVANHRRDVPHPPEQMLDGHI